VFIASIDDTEIKRKSYVVFKKSYDEMQRVFGNQKPLLKGDDILHIINNNNEVIARRFDKIFLYHQGFHADVME
jgi:hypothetical protein